MRQWISFLGLCYDESWSVSVREACDDMLILTRLRCSKLTRLLKDGLSGNSRTVMVATVSCGADQYHHTTNTLKYADRAKEIKTHIQVLTHMSWLVALFTLRSHGSVENWHCEYIQGSQQALWMVYSRIYMFFRLIRARNYHLWVNLLDLLPPIS